MSDSDGWTFVFTHLLRVNGHIVACRPTGSADMTPCLALTEAALRRCMLHESLHQVRISQVHRQRICTATCLPSSFGTKSNEYDSSILMMVAATHFNRALVSPQQWRDIVASVIASKHIIQTPSSAVALPRATQHSSGVAQCDTTPGAGEHDDDDAGPHTDLASISHAELVAAPASQDGVSCEGPASIASIPVSREL